MFRFLHQAQPKQNISQKALIIYGEKERIDDLKSFIYQKYLQIKSDSSNNEIDINEYKFLYKMDI